jgi:hypothetical protein
MVKSINVYKQYIKFGYHVSVFVMLFIVSCKQPEKVAESIAETKDSMPGFDMTIFKKDGDAYILPWSDLLKLTFRDTFYQSLERDVQLPIFNDTLKALDGKLVVAEGYYIPVSETGDADIVILSAYPYSQCFFCGKAGVESIIDIIGPKNLPKLKTDTKIKFKGKLKLNLDDFNYLVYMLEDAEYIGKSD